MQDDLTFDEKEKLEKLNGNKPENLSDLLDEFELANGDDPSYRPKKRVKK